MLFFGICRGVRGSSTRLNILVLNFIGLVGELAWSRKWVLLLGEIVCGCRGIACHFIFMYFWKFGRTRFLWEVVLLVLFGCVCVRYYNIWGR